jgi:hypothetical protein
MRFLRKKDWKQRPDDSAKCGGRLKGEWGVFPVWSLGTDCSVAAVVFYNRGCEFTRQNLVTLTKIKWNWIIKQRTNECWLRTGNPMFEVHDFEPYPVVMVWVMMLMMMIIFIITIIVFISILIIWYYDDTKMQQAPLTDNWCYVRHGDLEPAWLDGVWSEHLVHTSLHQLPRLGTMNTSGDVVRMIGKRVHEFCDLYDLQYVNILYAYVSSGVYAHAKIYIVISRYTYLFLFSGLEHEFYFSIYWE